MARRVWPTLGLLALATLSGCGFYERAERPAWRAQAENACLARKPILASSFMRPMPEISGPGICGLEHPFKVSGLSNGAVALENAATMDCSMIGELDNWLAEVVQPAAQARFGQAVVTVNAFGAYSCRSVDNIPGARLSEHSFGNAIDIAGFKLADGRDIVVVRDWKKTDTQEAAFLREVHGGACQLFTTVLGPGADVFHYDHIHMDLGNHGQTNTGPRHYCKPAPPASLTPPPGPSDGLPPAPDVEEPMDVSRAETQDRALGQDRAPLGLMAQDSLSGALPPAPIALTRTLRPTYAGRAGAPLDLTAPSVDAEPTSAIK